MHGVFGIHDQTNSADRLTVASDGNVQIPADNARLQIGASQDLQLYHNSVSNGSNIDNITGDLTIRGGGGDIIINPVNNETAIYAIANDKVQLRYDNSTKLQTQSWGVEIVGALSATNIAATSSTSTFATLQIPSDNTKLQIGASQDLQLFHTGVFSNINNATGDLDISSDVTRLKNVNRTENFAAFLNNGQAEFYFDNSKKFLTTSSGAKITGNLELSSTYPSLTWTDTNHDSDYRITNNDGQLIIYDITNSAHRLNVNADGNIQIPADNKKLQIGAGQDLELFHTGSTSEIRSTSVDNFTLRQFYGGGYMFIHGDNLHLRSQSTNELYFTGVNNGAASLYYDNSKKFETTSAGAVVTGNLGVGENSPDSILHIKSFNPDLHIENTGTGTGQLRVGHFTNGAFIGTYNDDGGGSDNLRLGVHSGDTKLTITSNGVDVTGGVSVTSSISIPDAVSLFLGNSNDLSLKHDGTDSFIKNTTGHLKIGDANVRIMNAACDEDLIHAKQNEEVELYFDNSPKLETTSSGVKISGTLLDINTTSANSAIVKLQTNVNSCEIEGRVAGGENHLILSANNSVDSLKITGAANGTVQLPNDNQELQIGAGQDLKLYHDGTNSAIQNTTGHLYLYAGTNRIYIRAKNDEDSIVAIPNDSVELYFDNSKKLETYANGIKLGDNVLAAFGNDIDLLIHHTGSTGYIKNQTGNFYIQNDGVIIIGNQSASTTGLKFNDGGPLELYHNNSKKLETTSTGVSITGNITASGGQLTLEEGNEEQIHRFWAANNDSDISGLLSGSVFGTIVEGANNGHHVIGLRDNDGADSFAIISGGGDFQTDNTYDTLVCRFFSNGVINIPDNGVLKFGTGNDLQILHDGNHSRIKDAGTGNLFIHGTNTQFINAAGTETIAKFTENGPVELWHDNSKKFETTSTGVSITGHADITGELNLIGSGAKYLDVDTLSNSNTFQIRHRSDTGSNFHNAAHFIANGGVKLYHDNSKKFETTSGGVTVTGKIFADSLDMGDNQRVLLGASDDLQLFHDGSNSFISESGTGNLVISTTSGSIRIEKNTGEPMIFANVDGSIELYYDNSKKLETSSEGVKHTLSGDGTIRFDQISQANSRFQNLTYSRSGNSRGDCSVVAIGEGSSSQGHIKIITSAGNSSLSGGVELLNGNTAFNAISDIRLKNKISDITDALTNIDKIEPIKYSWKYDKENTPHIGVSAQSVNEVYPEIVELTRSSTDESDKTDYLSILHTELIPICIAAIKELKAKVEALERA